MISKTEKCEKAHKWSSDGSGTFEISEVDEVDFSRGTKIIIQLKPETAEFCSQAEVKKIVQRYSNFLNFPIVIDGDRFNLVEAIWARSKSDISEEEYTKFWEYISNSKIEYKYKLHYSTDAPLSIKALLFTPTTHQEKYGMSAEEMEVSLYARKVLIKPKCKELFPNYLRFLKGVVDCEDLPLNISRENYQDTGLIRKLS